jgi:hypothetical protein
MEIDIDIVDNIDIDSQIRSILKRIRVKRNKLDFIDLIFKTYHEHTAIIVSSDC